MFYYMKHNIFIFVCNKKYRPLPIHEHVQYVELLTNLSIN